MGYEKRLKEKNEHKKVQVKKKERER